MQLISIPGRWGCLTGDHEKEAFEQDGSLCILLSREKAATFQDAKGLH